MIEIVERKKPADTWTTRSWLYLGAAAVLPMITSSAWYVVLGSAWIGLLADRGVDLGTAGPQAWQMVGQLVRNSVVVLAIAALVRRLHVRRPLDAVKLGLLVWLGFQAMAVLGSVLHEGYPFALYLIHTGDALQATLLMTVLIYRANS
jgi:hypothetical protein